MKRYPISTFILIPRKTTDQRRVDLEGQIGQVEIESTIEELSVFPIW